MVAAPDDRPASHPQVRPTDRPAGLFGALGWLASALAALLLLLTLVGGASGGWSIDLAWAPTLGLRLQMASDGLAVTYSLLATGIGLLVFVYAIGYIPRHLAHERRPQRDAWRFWAWMVIFMLAMVGLAASQDLILMFLFFDLTAVASYFLIGFDRHKRTARGAALVALVVTTGSAIAMLIGAVMLNAEYGTFSVPEIAAQARPSAATSAAVALIAVAALAKSAQAPLHFWLPRAMAAPTPVSAYLHSAAMVAAGVLVLGRIHPLLALDAQLLGALVVVGFVSIFVGGILALAQGELKQVLANSTISQYGYVVVLYGIGGPEGAAGAALYVVAHAMAKSALFMTAGYVTEATGETRLDQLGGLWRRMPLLAAAAGVAAASMAALPLTLGFFKDELYFTAAAASGPLVQVVAVLGAALTLAYIGRFWLAIFAGPRLAEARPVPRTMLLPIVTLAVLGIAGGIVVGPFAGLAAQAASVIHGTPVDVAPAYHLDAGTANLMAIAAWAIGLLVLVAARPRTALARTFARLGHHLGPRRIYGIVLEGIDRASESIHQAEVRDLRTSLAAILVPTGVLAGLGFIATPAEGIFRVGEVRLADLPMVLLLALAVAGALTAARDSGRLRPVLSLSVLGFALAGVYAMIGAPDVALVAVIIETVLTLVFLAVFARLPPTPLAAAPVSSSTALRASLLGRPGQFGRFRSAAAGIVAGVTAFAVIWSSLSQPPQGKPDFLSHIELTPAAHGGDVVTVILADFRGLDTMVEISVLAVAIIGVATLLRRRVSE